MIQGQSEGKHGAVAQLARDANISLLRSNDCLRDGQAHPSAANEISLVFSPVKFVEDHGLFEIVYARAAVGHAGRHCVSGKLGGNRNGLVLWRIKVGIVDELHEGLLSALDVSAHGRETVGHTDADVASGQSALAVCDGSINDFL